MRDAYFEPFAFFHNCVTIFEDQPDSIWVKETLAYLARYSQVETTMYVYENLIFVISTSQLPSLSRQRKLKRGRAILSDSEGDTSENELAATLAQQRTEDEDNFDRLPVSFHSFTLLKPITSSPILSASQFFSDSKYVHSQSQRLS